MIAQPNLQYNALINNNYKHELEFGFRKHPLFGYAMPKNGAQSDFLWLKGLVRGNRASPVHHSRRLVVTSLNNFFTK
jgi:hypothetical protein